jgi:hypothetical protein
MGLVAIESAAFPKRVDLGLTLRRWGQMSSKFRR